MVRWEVHVYVPSPIRSLLTIAVRVVTVTCTQRGLGMDVTPALVDYAYWTPQHEDRHTE